MNAGGKTPVGMNQQLMEKDADWAEKADYAVPQMSVSLASEQAEEIEPPVSSSVKLRVIRQSYLEEEELLQTVEE